MVLRPTKPPLHYGLAGPESLSISILDLEKPLHYDFDFQMYFRLFVFEADKAGVVTTG